MNDPRSEERTFVDDTDYADLDLQLATDVNAQKSKSQIFWGSIRNPDGVIDDLIGRVEFLLNHFDLWSEDGCFTFPDGETWERRHSQMPKVDGNPRS